MSAFGLTRLLFAPVSGKVTAVNEDLDGEPGLVNTAPYEGGWLFEVELSDASQVDALMDAAGYTDYPLAVSGSAAPEGPAMTRP